MLLGGKAGLLAGPPVRIQDVFNIKLYNGLGANQDLFTGVNLATYGGMAWFSTRNVSNFNNIFDTARGIGAGTGQSILRTATTSGALGVTDALLTFNQNGVTLGPDATNTGVNYGVYSQVLWSFRKSPKFFDVVTYVGDGASTKTISHNLASDPGMVVGKSSYSSTNWFVWHRGLGTNQNILWNNSQVATTGTPIFTVNNGSGTITVYSTGNMNIAGWTYVVYLFAHDPDTTYGLIQCGNYRTTNGTTLTVNLGWQPQYVMTKTYTTNTYDWMIYDSARGVNSGTDSGPDYYLTTDNTNVESSHNGIDFLPNGFRIPSGQVTADWIYMAIRQGPM